MYLSKEERKKFAAYLREDADSNMAIVEQLNNLPHADALRVLRETKCKLADAQRLVAQDLDSGE